MAQAQKIQATEREYVIPLRREFLKVPRYRRGGRAIKTIKQFIAKHMKVPDRDTSKVKLDVYLNNEVLFRGRKSPPGKIKVRVKKDDDIVKVSFAETPQHVKFLRLKHSKKHKAPEKKPAPAPAKPTAEQPLSTQAKEQTPEQKKEEKEKEQSVAQLREKQAHQQARAEKHIVKGAGPQVQRKALKK